MGILKQIRNNQVLSKFDYRLESFRNIGFKIVDLLLTDVLLGQTFNRKNSLSFLDFS